MSFRNMPNPPQKTQTHVKPNSACSKSIVINMFNAKQTIHIKYHITCKNICNNNK